MNEARKDFAMVYWPSTDTIYAFGENSCESLSFNDNDSNWKL